MANKLIKKFSKKTVGKSLGTVTDFVDLFSQLVSEYFDRKYKIKKKVEDVKRLIIKTLFNLKKEFMKTLVEGLFLVTGIAALIVGIILYLMKYFPLETILLVYGLVVTIIVLLRMRLNP